MEGAGGPWVSARIITGERLRRIRVIAGRMLSRAPFGAAARHRLGGLRRRLRAKEEELRSAEDREASLGVLVEELRGISAGAVPYEASATAAPRVLLFTGRGWNRPTPLVDGLLFHALRQRGAECTAVLCGAALPACEVETVATHEASALLSRGRPRICESCVGDGSRIFGGLDVPFRTLRRVLDGAAVRQANRTISSLAYDEYFDYYSEGIPVGAHARATLMRYLLSGRLEDGPVDRAVAKRFMVSALLVLESARRLVEELNPDVIVANHGIYNMSGVFGDVGASSGSRTVAWCRGYRKRTMILSHGRSYHYEMMDEPTSEWECLKPSPEQSQRLDDYLASRNRGGMDWVTYHPQPIEDRDVLIRTLGLDTARPIIGLFTNVNWDAQIVYPMNAFSDQLSWLIETIEHFRRRPDLQLVIRVHPAETKDWDLSRQLMADEIRQAFPCVPSNVHIIPPESDLSSYTLVDLIDAGIVFATKLGLEMAVRGVPVVVAGDAWIRGKGFSYDASSSEDYARILQGIQRLSMTDEQVERARTYAYHFFFRRMIPFPVELGDKTMGEIVPSDVSALDDLRPGRNEAIDVICSGILSGTSFVFDGS
jgi:hypothetical protein